MLGLRGLGLRVLGFFRVLGVRGLSVLQHVELLSFLGYYPNNGELHG